MLPAGSSCVPRRLLCVLGALGIVLGGSEALAAHQERTQLTVHAAVAPSCTQAGGAGVDLEVTGDPAGTRGRGTFTVICTLRTAGQLVLPAVGTLQGPGGGEAWYRLCEDPECTLPASRAEVIVPFVGTGARQAVAVPVMVVPASDLLPGRYRGVLTGTLQY